MSEHTTPAAILREAARLLEWGGWWRGAARGPYGERCMTAALADAMPDDDPNMRLTLWRLLCPLTRGQQLEVWNDLMARDESEVRYVLLQAANVAENETRNA